MKNNNKTCNNWRQLWRGCRGRETLIYYMWEKQVGAATMEISVVSLKKLNINLPHDQAIMFLGIQPKNFVPSYRDTCSSCLLLLCSQTSIKWKHLDVQQLMDDRMVHFTTWYCSAVKRIWNLLVDWCYWLIDGPGNNHSEWGYLE